ncbi:MAG: nucleotidyltransferase domain-containing protein [Deltaproteobacteria bacterium]|nr:nucleotidyltransferase domain-containing protein [Deltaproteobacteria bacterium]
MVANAAIELVARRIAREFRPLRILLFGSYANKTATPDSDVDLLVILGFEGRAVDKSVEIRLKVRPPFPVDLLVKTPEQIQQRLKMGDSFIRDIIEHGQVLYEADHA